MRVFVLYPLSHIYGGLRRAAATPSVAKAVFLIDVRTFLSKTPNKEASPATARQLDRHTTEKYSLLFSFCARPIFLSFNEKSIFLRCSAQVFRQVAGLASI